MMVRRGIGMRGLGRGLGQTIPNPANYSAWGDFLNAAELANGIQPGSCNNPLTCDYTEYQAVYQAAIQAWQGLNSPTGSIVQQQAQQNAAAQAAAVQASAPVSTLPVVISSSAPPVTARATSARTPPAQSAVVVSTSPAATQAPAPTPTSSNGSQNAPGSTSQTTPAVTSPCALALFGETSCIGPIGSTTLLVLGGAAAVLFFMSQGKGGR